MSWKHSELLGVWILSWHAGGCQFSRSFTHSISSRAASPLFLLLDWALFDMGQGAQNSLPWVWSLILGVFAKVRKTLPNNFAHLRAREAWSMEHERGGGRRRVEGGDQTLCGPRAMSFAQGPWGTAPRPMTEMVMPLEVASGAFCARLWGSQSGRAKVLSFARWLHKISSELRMNP
jgi:hypothetical protein